MSEDSPLSPDYTEQTGYENFVTRGRGIDEYARRLGINPEEMRNQTILDLGSGEIETFSRDASEYGINVHSMNPQYSKSSVRERAQISIDGMPKWQGRSVAARAEYLPYADETFDKVFGMYLLMHIPDPENKYQVMAETVRVLKPGGEARYYPASKEDIDSALRAAKENDNIKIEHERVPGPAEEAILEYERDENYREAIKDNSPSRLVIKKRPEEN